MPPKMPPKIRKYESGFEKRKKKKKLEELTQSQAGALHKFLIKEQVPVENQNVEVEIPIDVNVDVDVETQNVNQNANLNVDAENVEDDNMGGDLNVDVENVSVDIMGGDLNVDVENVSAEHVEDENVEQANPFEHSLDICDPRTWNALDSKMIDLLVEKGPKRDIVNGPKDKKFRRFTTNLYTRVLSNNEKCHRDWLVYSKELDRRRIIRRKRQFDENLSTPSVELSGEESFRINYFIYIVDQAIVSLNKRFEQYQEYESNFGFLFTSHKLRSLDNATLKSCCCQLEQTLKHNEQSDIVGNELFVELRILREMLPEDKIGALDILKFLKDMDCFPNTNIAYRILLTIPVTVASAERSFSKLKLLKSYLRSTMLQERLNGLALIAVENDVLETVQYEDLIDEFASKSVRRIALFK